MKLLKWAGLVALISLPILLLAGGKRAKLEENDESDESNIFAEELND